jgi:hypothetical protein
VTSLSFGDIEAFFIRHSSLVTRTSYLCLFLAFNILAASGVDAGLSAMVDAIR